MKEITVDGDYYRTPKIEQLEGFKLIWYKVILRAIYDYVLYKESRNKSLKRLADGAEKWLFLSARETSRKNISLLPFNSLENLCTLLDLDMGEVRKFASKLNRTDIRKIEFFQRNKYKPRKKKNESI